MKPKSNGLTGPALAFFAVMIFMGLTSGLAAAGESDEQQMVNSAAETFDNFIQAENMDWLRENLPHARGLLIIPQMVKAGFVIGGSGGTGVLLAKDPQTGKWSQPAFYSLGAASIGLQIGGEVAEVLMIIQSQNGVDQLLGSSFKLGGDTSIAAGPIGAGVKGAITSDIVSFSRTKGAYAGASLEGAMINTRNELNTAYYGQPATPVDILIRQKVSNPGASALIAKITQAAKK